MTAPAPGTFEALCGALEQIAIEITEDIQPGGAGKLHTSLWWDPSIQLPAAYWWCPKGDMTKDSDRMCGRDQEDIQLVLSIAARPGRHVGADFGSLVNQGVLTRTRQILGRACEHPTDRLGGAPRARRNGFRLAKDRFGNADALVAEFPITVVLNTSY